MADLLTALALVPAKLIEAQKRALTRCTIVAHRDSRANSPRGPTRQQLDATRKHSKKWLSANRADLKLKRVMSGKGLAPVPSPGGLERSISMEVKETYGRVFVASSSEAGKYAAYIHDERGVKWQRLGPGSLAKPGKAQGVGEKFIERAIAGNRKNFETVFEDELAKALKL